MRKTEHNDQTLYFIATVKDSQTSCDHSKAVDWIYDPFRVVDYVKVINRAIYADSSLLKETGYLGCLVKVISTNLIDNAFIKSREVQVTLGVENKPDESVVNRLYKTIEPALSEKSRGVEIHNYSIVPIEGYDEELHQKVVYNYEVRLYLTMYPTDEEFDEYEEAKRTRMAATAAQAAGVKSPNYIYDLQRRLVNAVSERELDKVYEEVKRNEFIFDYTDMENFKKIYAYSIRRLLNKSRDKSMLYLIEMTYELKKPDITIERINELMRTLDKAHEDGIVTEKTVNRIKELAKRREEKISQQIKKNAAEHEESMNEMKAAGIKRNSTYAPTMRKR